MTSAFDKLRKSAEKTKPKSKGVLEIDNFEMETACDNFIISSRDFKNAEAALKRDKSIIIDFMRTIFAQTMGSGEAIKSFRLNSKLLCTFTDRFTAPSEQDVQEIQSAVGTATFDKLFKQTASVKLKESVASNEAKLSELLELLGDKADQFFDIGVTYSTIDDIDKLVAAEGCYEQLGDVLERLRYSPTIKTA